MSALDKLLKSDYVEPFGTGSLTKIRDYQKKYDVRFSREYQNFLVRCNGMLTSFDDDVRDELDLHMALTDINTFYGIGNGREYSDLALLTPRYGESTRHLMAFAPAIAIGGDSCELVEISQGRRINQIIYTDGELYQGFMRRTDWSRSPDDLIEDYIESGFFMPVADSFAELLAMYLVLDDHSEP